jgi:hypothetical protein
MNRAEIAAIIREEAKTFNVVSDDSICRGRRGRTGLGDKAIKESDANSWLELAEKIERAEIAGGLDFSQLPVEFQVMKVVGSMWNNSFVAKENLKYFC